MVATSLLLSPLLGGVAAAVDAERFFYFSPRDKFATRLDDRERDRWQQPEKVLDYLLLRPGESVADIGASTGYFSIPLARRVGASGRVYAVDLDRRTLDRVVERGRGAGLANIVPVLARTDDPRLPTGTLDLVFICNVFADLGDRPHYLGLLKRVLRKEGRLAVISYRAEETPVGPPLHTRLTRETIIDELLRAGFRFEAEYHFLPYQYFVVFVAP
jgi:ubiquinone/menaquinone biosynthesis C-methylase UbiE